MTPIYFDYAATTPMDPRVIEAMLPYFGSSALSRLTNQPINQLTKWGNPGSLHQFGQEASAAVFKARQTIADSIGAHYSEIIFTGSATEANNLALRGSVKQLQSTKYKVQKSGRPRIVISAVEHESVLKTAKDLENDGAEVIIVPVSKDGIIDLKKLKTALNERTVLVSVMYANNEVGTVQPIKEISDIIRNFRNSKLDIRNLDSGRKYPVSNIQYPLLHTDAAQAFQYLDCNIATLGVDLMTLSGHKIYGPKGIGVLYMRHATSDKRQGRPMSHVTLPLSPIISGGGQESGLRSGTENVPLIAGMAKAVELAVKLREKESKRVAVLSREFWKEIKKAWPGVQLNGAGITKYKLQSTNLKRLPNNLHIYFPGKSGEELMVALDLKGISVATGPACSSRTAEPSHVLLAMGYSKERAQNSLRITLGKPTTISEIKKLLAALKSLK